VPMAPVSPTGIRSIEGFRELTGDLIRRFDQLVRNHAHEDDPRSDGFEQMIQIVAPSEP